MLSEGKIGSLILQNRLIMPAMSETLTDKRGIYMDDEMAYYSERAKGGTGLIITSYGCVDPRGLGAANQICAYDREHIVSLKKITEGVHRFNGRIFLQLHHAGRAAESAVTGAQPMGPSAIPTALEFGGTLEMPREMTIEDIKDIVDKFIFSAVIAKKSNFDGVEIHCAHSYLLNQFISPLSNRRTDEYGGNTENRVRIVKEIIQGIREELGRSFPVSVRLEADEDTEGGLEIIEAAKIARLLEEYGADLINVSAGGYESTRMCIAPAGYKEEGFLAPLAAAIKREVSIPVAVVGMIRSFELADSLIEKGTADFVVMGRPHIADPHIINKLKSMREKEIRPCITCLHCTDSAEIGRMECSVNPTLGYEKDFQHFYKNGNGRRIVVVGGGPSGCEAARVLSVRGFEVTLLENDKALGGQVNLASKPPHKDRMDLLIEFYEYNLNRLGVKIVYNTKATVEVIKSYDPYAVFLATGSKPILPYVPGIDSDIVLTAERVLSGEWNAKGKRVAIVGSGNTGIETAKYLKDRGSEITIVDMLPEIGMLAGGSGRYVLADLLKEGIDTMPGMKLAGIENHSLKLVDWQKEEESAVETDYVVLSLGVRKNDELLKELKSTFPKVVAIGDAYQTGNIATAIKSAFNNAYYFDGKQEEMI